jgi:RNA polymerase sigma-70 factor (ECF subfamily)
VYGAERVARVAAGSFAKAHRFGIRAETVHVGGHPALRMSDPENRTVAVWSLLISDGVIVAIHGVVNPDKLTHLQSV